MKKYIITFIAAMIIGYVYGNFGNVSDFSAEFIPNSYEDRSRGGSFRNSYDYRGRGHNSLDYHGRDSDSSGEYESYGDEGQNSLDYRGRSSRTGRFVHRSNR